MRPRRIETRLLRMQERSGAAAIRVVHDGKWELSISFDGREYHRLACQAWLVTALAVAEQCLDGVITEHVLTAVQAGAPTGEDADFVDRALVAGERLADVIAEHHRDLPRRIETRLLRMQERSGAAAIRVVHDGKWELSISFDGREYHRLACQAWLVTALAVAEQCLDGVITEHVLTAVQAGAPTGEDADFVDRALVAGERLADVIAEHHRDFAAIDAILDSRTTNGSKVYRIRQIVHPIAGRAGSDG